MNSLAIHNLHAETLDGIKILHGITMTIKQGETHILMGPNGGGKSTLAQVLMGHPNFVITKGTIKLNNKDITQLPTNERAQKGLFLGFQYPTEIPGVNFTSFLRMAINENIKTPKEKLSPLLFRQKLSEQAKKLAFPQELLNRSLNEGFSGGEKKKAEILQLSLIKPSFAILDEPDSGLDVDSLKYISQALHSLKYPHGIILITHYQNILNYIKPDFIHILINGKIVASGDKQLGKLIEKEGYENFKIKTK